MAERNDRPQRARRPKKKVCMFCVDKVEHIDYKDTAKLRRYVTERGKIVPRRISGTVQSTKDSLQQLSSVQELSLFFRSLLNNCEFKDGVSAPSFCI